MSTDPIVEELDRQRAEKMGQFNFDFEAFYQELKAQERLLPQAVLPSPETPRNPRSRRTGGASVRK